MLQNLINNYEENAPLNLMGEGEIFANYLRKLQTEPLKISYLDLRVNNPTLTQKKISNQLGITEKTICEWKKDSLFKRTVIELLEQEYKVQKLEILNELFIRAKGGDYKAIQLFLKYTS